MDVTALRALQAPLKDRYRDAPDAAVITLKAHGELDDQHIACKVATRPSGTASRASGMTVPPRRVAGAMSEPQIRGGVIRDERQRARLNVV